MDAIKLGFKVILVEDLCKGVAKDTIESALKEMKSAGIRIILEPVLWKEQLVFF